jgi:hypothetical protein
LKPNFGASFGFNFFKHFEIFCVDSEKFILFEVNTSQYSQPKMKIKLAHFLACFAPLAKMFELLAYKQSKKMSHFYFCLEFGNYFFTNNIISRENLIIITFFQDYIF